MAVELSIIIPARGNARDLAACIESLSAQRTSINHEVIVAYCNRDVEVHETVSRFQFVQSVVASEYLLPGPARNLGATKAKADVLAFVDSDCILKNDWIEAAFYTIQSGAVLCSGVIKDSHPWDLIASSDNRLQYVDFPSGRPFGTSSYFPGVHLVLRKTIFELVGGFNSSPIGQDVIFTMEIASRWPSETIFNPKMIVCHAGRRTWKELLKHQETFGYARASHKIQINKFMDFISKHKWLWWIIFLRRFAYISMHVIKWNIADLPRYILQLPFILAGLGGWVRGYYRGWQMVNIKFEN